MKRFTLAIALGVASLLSHAQEGNNICVFNSLQTYDGGKGDPQDLVRAIKCSDEAIADASTSVKSKTWFYRGKLFTMISLDKTLKGQVEYANATFEVIKAYKKLYEINDPKFKDWAEVGEYLGVVSNNAAVSASEKANAKDYAAAYAYFYSIKDANQILLAKGIQPKIPTDLALRNAIASAENGGDNATAFKTAEELYKMQPDSLGSIQRMASLSKKTGQMDKYEAYLEEGLKKFPKDPVLLGQKIEIYLKKGDNKGALEFVNSFLQADPLNYNALNAKGQAYNDLYRDLTKQVDSLGTSAVNAKKVAELNALAKSYGDSLIQAYTQSININSKNVNAWRNLGVYYVDKANTYVPIMSSLGNSPEDMKKYEQLKKERKEVYIKAKEYLTKAKEFEPENADLTRILTKIDLLLAE